MFTVHMQLSISAFEDKLILNLYSSVAKQLTEFLDIQPRQDMFHLNTKKSN